jgi:hypothetical protein
MGLFDFVKDIGNKLFNRDEEAAEKIKARVIVSDLISPIPWAGCARRRTSTCPRRRSWPAHCRGSCRS